MSGRAQRVLGQLNSAATGFIEGSDPRLTITANKLTVRADLFESGDISLAISGGSRAAVSLPGHLVYLVKQGGISYLTTGTSLPAGAKLLGSINAAGTGFDSQLTGVISLASTSVAGSGALSVGTGANATTNLGSAFANQVIYLSYEGSSWVVKLGKGASGPKPDDYVLGIMNAAGTGLNATHHDSLYLSANGSNYNLSFSGVAFSYVIASEGLDTGRNVGVSNDAKGDLTYGFENLTGSEFDDTLTGDARDNILQGRGGADRLDGGAGTDTASYAAAPYGVTIDMNRDVQIDPGLNARLTAAKLPAIYNVPLDWATNAAGQAITGRQQDGRWIFEAKPWDQVILEAGVYLFGKVEGAPKTSVTVGTEITKTYIQSTFASGVYHLYSDGTSNGTLLLATLSDNQTLGAADIARTNGKVFIGKLKYTKTATTETVQQYEYERNETFDFNSNQNPTAYNFTLRKSGSDFDLTIPAQTYKHINGTFPSNDGLGLSITGRLDHSHPDWRGRDQAGGLW